MKVSKTQSASKMISRFDSQLKKIIMNDLKAIKAVKAKLAAMQTQHLSIA
jgi:hypothetical protein